MAPDPGSSAMVVKQSDHKVSQEHRLSNPGSNAMCSGDNLAIKGG